MLAVTNVDSWLLLLRLLLAIILLHIIARLVQPRIGFVPKDKPVKDRSVMVLIPSPSDCVFTISQDNRQEKR